MHKTLLCTAVCLLAVAYQGTSQAADVEAGKKAFNKCAVCHSPEQGVTRVGPSLFGIIGRKAGTLPGYNFSTAMKNYDVTWSAQTLNTYLAAPMQEVKGTKMTFAGVKDETERANIIAYLETLK